MMVRDMVVMMRMVVMRMERRMMLKKKIIHDPCDRCSETF